MIVRGHYLPISGAADVAEELGGGVGRAEPQGHVADVADQAASHPTLRACAHAAPWSFTASQSCFRSRPYNVNGGFGTLRDGSGRVRVGGQ